MQITKPTFYKEFSCIAGACPDTCCAGWQIMIDEKSLQKYRRLSASVMTDIGYSVTPPPIKCGGQHCSVMQLILFPFIDCRWSGSYQAHITSLCQLRNNFSVQKKNL